MAKKQTQLKQVEKTASNMSEQVSGDSLEIDSQEKDDVPAWKQPGIKLDFRGAELSTVILNERESGS